MGAKNFCFLCIPDFSVLDFLVGDVLIEGGTAAFADWDEVETDTAEGHSGTYPLCSRYLFHCIIARRTIEALDVATFQILDECLSQTLVS